MYPTLWKTSKVPISLNLKCHELNNCMAIYSSAFACDSNLGGVFMVFLLIYSLISKVVMYNAKHYVLY